MAESKAMDKADKSKKLPQEMWRVVFEQPWIHNTADLANIICPCKTLQPGVEAVLYRTIKLQNFSQFEKLACALRLSPRLIALVRDLSIFWIITIGRLPGKVSSPVSQTRFFR